MTSEDKATQMRVGIFILVGLITVGLMVVYFGRLGEGFAKYYNIRVEFSNASGLVRGSEVLLAGAKVGRIVNAPTIMPDMRGVFVELRILEEVRIPDGSRFAVGSSGLLGDKFVEVSLDAKGTDKGFIQPGAVIKGDDGSGGIAGVASNAGELITDLKTTVGNINSVVKKLDETVLSKQELASISDTVKNLQTASGRIAEASSRIDGLLAKTDGAIQGGKETIDTAKKAADDVHKLVEQARSGKGPLGTLVGNKEMADNLRALVLNLRKHGILWYKDTAPRPAGDAEKAENE